MVKTGLEVSGRSHTTGSESFSLRRERSSSSLSLGVLLPGRRRLLQRGTSSGSDSDGSEGEERAVLLPRRAKSTALQVVPKTGLRKPYLSLVTHSEDRVGSEDRAGLVAENLLEDVIYVKTERVSLSQTFLTSCLINKRSRV
jgi:hypothetical protein